MKAPFKIFTPTSNVGLPKAAEENKITIEIHNPMYLDNAYKSYGKIVGYLSKEFSYSARGSYSNVMNVPNIDMQLLKVASDEFQRNVGNYGYATKKTYQDGDSAKINVEFRIYGDMFASSESTFRNPIQIANALVAMTTPQVANNAMFLFDRVALARTSPTDVAGSTAAKYEAASGPLDLFSVTADTLTSRKPPVCKLTIGRIFKKDMMVVSSIEVTMSKEFYAEGIPLHTDFQVQFESLFDSVSIDNGSEEQEEIFGTGLGVEYMSRISFSANSNQDILKAVDSRLGTDLATEKARISKKEE